MVVVLRSGMAIIEIVLTITHDRELQALSTTTVTVGLYINAPYTYEATIARIYYLKYTYYQARLVLAINNINTKSNSNDSCVSYEVKVKRKKKEPSDQV
jgi:hypothetical protein